MKNRFFRVILPLLILIATCSGCTPKYTCKSSDVKSIQIVTLTEYLADEYMYAYDVLCEIEDIASFVEQLNQIDCETSWGPPLQLNTGYTVVKIDYHNGDFDLLHFSAQWIKRSDNVRYGYYYFDEAQFMALVSSHLK